MESGNEEEDFTLVTDKQTNEVSLVLSKVKTHQDTLSAPTQTHFPLLVTSHTKNKIR